MSDTALTRLQPVESHNGTLPIGIPEHCYTTSVYHRWYERNAWHSTRTARAWRIDYSVEFDTLKSAGGQGSVWYIQSLPAIAMKYIDRTLVLCRDQDGDKKIYQPLKKAATERPLNSFWRALGQDDFIRLFICSDFPARRFHPETWRYRQWRWVLEENTQKFPEFIKFSRRLKSEMKFR